MKDAQWQDRTNMLLGLWLAISPLIGIGVISDTAAINAYVVGIAVLFFAMSAVSKPDIWQEYSNLVLGFWLIVAPFALGFANLIGPTVNQVLVGFLVGGIALKATLDQSSPTAHGGHGHGHV